MTIRNLDSLFRPRSVVVIGASDRPGSVGATVWRNLRSGGFAGPVLAVNPRRTELDGQPVYARVSDLPAPADLAIVCSPAATVPQLIEELGAKGTRAAIVVTAGLDTAEQQAMLNAARKYTLRILGPNCIGMLAPPIGLNASFAHRMAKPGGLAFVTQSGALLTAMLDWADARGIGFSRLVSLGEHADIDFGDLLDYLANDGATQAILLYIESITSARKFMSAARAAARNKPVIVIKAGRSNAGARAAASHTGALAGSDLVYDAAIARAGMLRVDTLQQLFLAAETLSRPGRPRQETLAILTNGGGAGVMAADAAAHVGVDLTDLDADTLAALDRLLPANWSHANPLDIIGDAPVARYVDALRLLLDAPAGCAVLFIHAPTAIVSSTDIADALIPLARRDPGRMLACWLGDRAVATARDRFWDAGIACFETPELAVRAFAMGVAYRRNQAELLQTPADQITEQPASARSTAASIVTTALQEGRTLLSEVEAKAVLSAYGIAVVPTCTVSARPSEAARVAGEIGFPVALKILSPDISHKSDVGGVALNLADPQAVDAAALAMLERVRAMRPQARLTGFTVQPMISRPHARELIVGTSVDPVFGPVVLFGAGGTAVEVLRDRAVALPPLNQPLADALVQRTRVARLLDAWRDTPAADLQALQRVLVAVSALLSDLPQLAELDINPLLCDEHGALALDARIRVDALAPGGADRFAIRPYPAQRVQSVQWQGQPLTIRPIRPQDEAQHRSFLESVAPADIRLRVFYTRRSIDHDELARLTQIDYEREMAFVAERPADATAGAAMLTLGTVRAIVDPDNESAEFGVLVRSELKGQGLGRLLMGTLIHYLQERGTRWIVGLVLAENEGMLALARALGFVQSVDPEDPGVRLVRLDLQSTDTGTRLANAHINS